MGRVVTEKCMTRVARTWFTMSGMDGVLGEDLENPSKLTERVYSELVSLRGQPGKLTIQKFSQFDALRTVCGGGDLLDAYLMFEREMNRYITTAGRNEIAAAVTIVAPAETVLDRLEHAVGALPQDGKLRDQRTARRWSDEGLITIARDLVYMAQVQGRLGQELLGVEIGGDQERGMLIAVDQITSLDVPDRAPLIRVWHYRDGEPEEHTLTADLDSVVATTARNDEYVMKRHNLEFALPAAFDISRHEGPILSVSIEGRDAPMRTVSVQDRSQFSGAFEVSVMIYRTIVTVTLSMLLDVNAFSESAEPE